MNYEHTQRQKTAAAKKPAQKSSLFFFFAFPPSASFPHPLYSDDPKNPRFSFPFSGLVSPSNWRFISNMPHSMMLFSAKPENYTSPDFPPRKKREGNETEYISPPDSHAPPLPLSLFPRMWKEEKGEKESTPKNGGGGTNRCIFIPAFEPKPNLFLEWLFPFFSLGNYVCVRGKKGWIYFEGGRFWILISSRARGKERVFGNEKELEWIFLGVKGWRRRFFDAATCCFLPHFFYQKKLWKKISESDFFVLLVCACDVLWAIEIRFYAPGVAPGFFGLFFLRENCIIFIFSFSFLFGEPSALKYPVFSHKTLREERKTERLCPFLSSLSHPPI